MAGIIVSSAVLVATMALVPAPSASAEAAGEITIARLSASPLGSGSTFSYLVNFTCEAVDDVSCDGVEIRIPLTNPVMFDAPPAHWLFGVDSDGIVASHQVSGPDYVIRLVDGIATGISHTLTFKVTPPNG